MVNNIAYLCELLSKKHDFGERVMRTRMVLREFETLKDTLYQTVHRSDKSIAALAEEIGMTANYLYKACMPDLDTD